MKLLDKFTINGRGAVFTFDVDCEFPIKDARVRRLSDGATWPIRGFDRYCMFSGRPLVTPREKTVGILVPDGCELAVGDDVEIVSFETEQR